MYTKTKKGQNKSTTKCANNLKDHKTDFTFKRNPFKSKSTKSIEKDRKYERTAEQLKPRQHKTVDIMCL